LLDDTEEAVKRIIEFVGVPQLKKYDMAEKEIKEFVSKKLQHYRSEETIEDIQVRSLYDSLLKRCYNHKIGRT